MHTLIVFESMYGNTHTVAEKIAEGLAPRGDVTVVPAYDVTDDLVAWADIVVVGGPTHAHGVTSAATRKSAREAAAKPGSGLSLDPDSGGPGLRDWFDGLGDAQGKRAAAFDTRIDMAAVLTGRASRGIAQRLRRHGFKLVVQPESFLVDKHNTLLAGEADRAVQWGARLADVLTAVG
ncbi:MAG: flavodoxin family protein [Actinomycetes bacterium]